MSSRCAAPCWRASASKSGFSDSSVRDGSTMRVGALRLAHAGREAGVEVLHRAHRRVADRRVGDGGARRFQPRPHDVGGAVVDEPAERRDDFEPDLLGVDFEQGHQPGDQRGVAELADRAHDRRQRTLVGDLEHVDAAPAGRAGCRSRPARRPRARAPTSPRRGSPRSGNRPRARPWSGSGSRSRRGVCPRPGRGSGRARPRSRAVRRSSRARRRRGCAPTSRRP